MRRLVLRRLGMSGLKSRDRIVDIRGSVLVLLGVNGAGKSAFIQALHLMATGRAPGAPAGRGYDSVLALSREGRIVISAVIEDLDAPGKTLTCVRTWERDRDGKGSSTCTGTLVPKGSRKPEAAVEALLGAMVQAWTPASLIEGPSASPTQLRRTILDLCGGGEAEQYVPPGLPSGWLPQDGESADVWVKRAIGAAKRAAAVETDELRRVTTSLEDLAPETPAPIAPLQARLAALRAEARSAEPRALAEAKVATFNGRLTAMRAQVIEDSPRVSDAARELEAAIAAKAEAGRAEAARQNLVMARRDLMHVDERLRGIAIPPGPAPTEEEDTAAAEVLHAVRAVVREARATYAAQQARVEALAESARRAGHCRKCGDDLAAQGRELLDEAHAAKVAAEGAVLAAEALEAEETERWGAICDLRAAASLREDRVKLLAEISTLEAQVPPPGADPAARLAKARSALSVAERQADLRDQLGTEEVDYELALAELAEIPPPARTAAEIEAAIAGVERELAAAGRAEQRARDREGAVLQIEVLTRRANAAAAMVTALERVERDMLAHVRGRIEKVASERAGEPITVELVDARGGETCRLFASGVDAATKSKGERIVFLASLVSALAAGSTAEWRPLVVDEIESVSRDRRAAFVRACLDAVASGAVSQAFLGGCPDTWEPIEGVQVLDLDAAPAPSVAREGVAHALA